MVKTQVQIPDALFREAKRLAAEHEMSFAEVVRRGLEEIIRHHPPGRCKAETWTVPGSFDMGEPLAPEEEWTTLCRAACSPVPLKRSIGSIHRPPAPQAFRPAR